ncbi:MAG: carboxymuconolactone decarboxylase family protein [Candidatus Freyarchaeota archaeon]
MARIKMVDEEEAKGKIKEVYDAILSKEPHVPGILKIFSVRPDLLEKMVGIHYTLMGSGSLLSPELRNYIALTVSVVNSCDYCYESYVYTLRELLAKTDEEIDDIIENFAECDLDMKTIMAVNFARKATEQPTFVTDEDIERLRKVGFRDEEILEIATLMGYFNMINRIVDALGLKPEEY